MKDIQTLESHLGIPFTNKVLLTQAVTHRSYLNEARGDFSSNERLEFLGDAILSFLVSRKLYAEFSDLPEGELTNLRSAIVRTESLSLVSSNLHLGDFLLLSRGEEDGGGRTNPSLLADCFEAVVGAMYLDQGLDMVSAFVEKNLLVLLPEIIRTRAYKDFKSEFQEKVQERMRVSPVYKVLKEEGPDHAKLFTIGVYVGDELQGEGQGKSKQDAEQHAARLALEKWTSLQ